jgi:hypothetical protein
LCDLSPFNKRTTASCSRGAVPVEVSYLVAGEPRGPGGGEKRSTCFSVAVHKYFKYFFTFKTILYTYYFFLMVLYGSVKVDT